MLDQYYPNSPLSTTYYNQMITVWGRLSSSNVQAVMWCCAELNLATNRVDAGFSYGVTDTPEYLAMNPNGTVPTIKDDNNPPLWESGAIIRYLANKYGSDSFWPQDELERAHVDRWAEWSKVTFATNFTGPIFWQAVRIPKSRRDHNALKAASERIAKILNIADNQLAAQTYLTGEHLTVADIQLGHCLYRYFDINIKRAELPNLQRYYQSLTDRPAYRENVMVSYDELIDSM